MFVSEHCSLLASDHLSELCKCAFSDSKFSDIRLHRTKCTEIIKNVLAPHFSQELVADIGDQKYSLKIDESTDISVVKLLGISVRYFSRNLSKVVSTFLGIVELERGDADSMVEGILYMLSERNLNPNNFIGLGTDNASVMTGVNNGVFAKLKEKLQNPYIVLFRYVCHSLQLAVSHAYEATLPSNLDFLIK